MKDRILSIKNQLVRLALLSLLIVGLISAITLTHQRTDNRQRAAETKTVTIQNMAFTPKDIVVYVGDTVTWVNRDGMMHTVTSDDSVFDSGDMAQDETFSQLFTEEGVYPYTCKAHPSLKGTVTVLPVNAQLPTQPGPTLTPAPDGSPPQISGVKVASLTNATATITWNTDEPTFSQIEYGKTIAYESTTSFSSSAVKTHSRLIADLSVNTLYHFRVRNKDAAGNISVSPDQTFTTPPANASTLGTWSPLLNWPLVAIHATLMHTGEVLMWDASKIYKVWNPTTDTFTDVSLGINHKCGAHTPLADGRIFAVGGTTGSSVGIVDSSFFDPVAKKWTAAANMRYARWYPAVTMTTDGSVIVMGGQSKSGTFVDIPEIYTFNNATWTPINSINTSDAREGNYLANYILPNGKLFVMSPSKTAVRTIDLTTYASTPLASTPIKRGTPVMYRPGKILISGGSALNQTAIIDMNQSSPTWKTTGPMAVSRTYHNSVVLPDGKVVTVGGSSSNLTSEMWDPITETWTTMAAMNVSRLYHSVAILLPDGRVLSAGGNAKTAQIYSPPYLFKGARPVITSGPATAGYGQTLTVTSPDAQEIASVSLIAPGSVTHTVDMSQRYIELNFTITNNGLQVTFPSGPTIAPPGYYMFFIVNSSGVPSVARMIKVDGTVKPTITPPLPTATRVPTIPTNTPIPTITPSIIPSPTPIPTVLPSKTPTARPTITPTRTPTVAFTPIPTITITSLPQARITFTAFLHGIGNGGDNANPNSTGNVTPIHTQRSVRISVFALDGTLIQIQSGMLTYNSTTGNYTGNATFTNLPSNRYVFRIKPNQYLQRTVLGAPFIAVGQETVLPSVTFIAGDINEDNMLNVLDYTMIIDCFSTFSQPRNCPTDKKLKADITDDNEVNQFDLNLLLRELSVQIGS